jgi:hypothetical protein
MLSQCANPGCTNRFRFLHDGRVFVVDCSAQPAFNTTDDAWEPPQRRIETFWLCAECAQSLTVRFDGKRVVTVPRSASAGDSANSSQNAA